MFSLKSCLIDEATWRIRPPKSLKSLPEITVDAPNKLDAARAGSEKYFTDFRHRGVDPFTLDVEETAGSPRGALGRVNPAIFITDYNVHDIHDLRSKGFMVSDCLAGHEDHWREDFGTSGVAIDGDSDYVLVPVSAEARKLVKAAQAGGSGASGSGTSGVIVGGNQYGPTKDIILLDEIIKVWDSVMGIPYDEAVKELIG